MVGHDAGQSFADPAGSMSVSTARRLRLRWVMGDAAPAIEASGTLYALTSDQKVVALDPKSGAVRHRYLSTKVQSLAHAGNLVYFNLGSEIRYVDDKTAAWHHTASDKQGGLLNAFSSVVATDRVLYSGVGVQNSGYVERAYAFDATTGKTLWSIEGNPSSAPCVVGNSVYLSFGSYGNGDTDVVDATTGAVRNVLRNLGTAQWHTSGNRLYASVLHGGGNNLTASVRAYTLGGKLLWVGHDVLFGAALPDRMFGVTATAVDARSAVDGHRLWKHAVPGLRAIAPGSVAIVGKLLLVQAQSGTITLLDSGTGAVLGVLRPPSPASAAGDLIAGDGLVFERITIKAAGAPAKSELLAFGL